MRFLFLVVIYLKSLLYAKEGITLIMSSVYAKGIKSEKSITDNNAGTSSSSLVTRKTVLNQTVSISAPH